MCHEFNVSLPVIIFLTDLYKTYIQQLLWTFNVREKFVIFSNVMGKSENIMLTVKHFLIKFPDSSSSSVALQPGVGLGLLYNMPPSLLIPCSVSPFIYSHLSQVHGHVIQPSHFWSSSSSCCIQLSVQHLFWNCCVLHSFYVTKPSYSLAFNEPDNVLPLDYNFKFIVSSNSP